MARIIPREVIPGLAKLDIKLSKDGNQLKVNVTPSEDVLERGRADPNSVITKRIHMITVDKLRKRFEVYPHYTRPEEDGSFKPKFGQSTFSFDWSGADLPKTTDDVYELLYNQPSCFISDPNFGLGLKVPYRAILSAASELSTANVIYIGDQEPTKGEFKISKHELRDICIEIDRIDRRAQVAESEVKRTTSYNLLAVARGKNARSMRLGRNEIRQLIQKFAADPHYRDEKSQVKLVAEVAKSARAFATANPAGAEKLITDVQLTRLELAIAEYRDMIARKLHEVDWQKFFQREPFLLSFAFGYPVTFVHGQSFVGGRRIDGTGEKIGDFLYKNSLNNNAALIEIKKPDTKLLKKYRDDVFRSDDELSGGISQVLDQRYRLTANFSQHLRDNKWSGDRALEDYDIDCVLIIGQMPQDVDQRRSLQILRKNSHSVKIVTFDEVLKRLEEIREFIIESKPTKKSLTSGGVEGSALSNKSKVATK